MMTKPLSTHSPRQLSIGGTLVGAGAPVFVIAEIGNTHEGSFGQAQALMTAAAESGAHAVKLQTHLADAETVEGAPFPPYFRPGEARRAYFDRIAFNESQYRDLSQLATSLGVVLLSSPFSAEAVDVLDGVGISAYKVPSGEVTNLPYLDHLARTNKPVLLSSGMSSWEELDRAVETIRRYHDQIVVLQCTSIYPCPPERVGLNVLEEMAARYDSLVGLSDHTLTTSAALAAVALGACVIEKHFTLSTRMFGPDPQFSLEPQAFADLTKGIREIEIALQHPVDKNNLDDLSEMKAIFEKSIVAARDLASGTIIEPDDLATKKPGTGLAPRLVPQLIGRRTTCFLQKDTLLTETHLA
jgi:N,N'-diacetyllegionaminate synthase